MNNEKLLGIWICGDFHLKFYQTNNHLFMELTKTIIPEKCHLCNTFNGIKNILQKCREIIKNKECLLSIQEMLYKEI